MDTSSGHIRGVAFIDRTKVWHGLSRYIDAYSGGGRRLCRRSNLDFRDIENKNMFFCFILFYRKFENSNVSKYIFSFQTWLGTQMNNLTLIIGKHAFKTVFFYLKKPF